MGQSYSNNENLLQDNKPKEIEEKKQNQEPNGINIFNQILKFCLVSISLYITNFTFKFV